MRLAIYLASRGESFEVKTNPKVGAVLVHHGKIIGQGYHIRRGEAHAEINCLNSVPDNLRSLIRESTMYVTLEPCAHEGRTPSCAKRLVQEGIRRVVIGTLDPFPLVSGKGCQILRDGGVEVMVGLLEKECKEVAKVFMTNHTQQRPFVTLKWAESADGYVDTLRTPDQAPAKISSPFIQILTHKLRGEHDAILIGKHTMICDRPQLNNRLFPGLPSPEAYILDSLGESESLIPRKENWHIIKGGKSITEILSTLYNQNVSSLLVEGGPQVLKSFINSGLWDSIRQEIGDVEIGYGIKAPSLPVDISISRTELLDHHQINYYTR